MAVIFGTLGPDNLIGTLNNDYIYAAPFLSGLQDKSKDTVDGGAGNDRIWTYSGADHALGGSGNDTIRGGSGDDSLQGMSGDDVLKGEADDDALFGQNGQDYIEGGDGSDRLQGDTDADILFGEAGDDSLFGGGQDDNLIGGGGNDSLIGNSGGDFLNGGPGINAVWGDDSGGLTAGADTFGYFTHDGAGTEYFIGPNTTTVRDFAAGQDELYFGKVYYTDGSKVTNADATGNGIINSADKGWSVVNSATGPELHFAGWNHELILRGLSSIPATDIRIETGSPILIRRP